MCGCAEAGTTGVRVAHTAARAPSSPEIDEGQSLMVILPSVVLTIFVLLYLTFRSPAGLQLLGRRVGLVRA
jgi:hypothetical protein